MIWLVIPETFEGERGAGQWKDLQGIRLVLDRLGAEWREFRFDGNNAEALAALIGNSGDTAIWYYTFWPEQMGKLKARCPRVRIVLRTVNAEAFQHWTRAEKDWSRIRGLPRDIYGFLRLLGRDRSCCRVSGSLAGISLWDDVHYWRWLAGPGKLRFVPYVSPWPFLLPEVKPVPWDRRENIIVCLAGTRDVIGRGHVAGFAALARHPELSAWRCASSAGFMDASQDDLPAGTERLGRIEEPWTWLCKVKAVAVLSPFGYGYKTTVADALAAGCHVLVHPRQHVRLSPEEQPLCIPVDPDSGSDVRRAGGALSRPPSDAGTAQRKQWERGVGAWKEILFP